MVDKKKLRATLGRSFLKGVSETPSQTTEEFLAEQRKNCDHDWSWKFKDVILDNNTKLCKKCGKEIQFKDGKKIN